MPPDTVPPEDESQALIAATLVEIRDLLTLIEAKL